MSTYENILRITDTLIQQRGFLGFSYADLEKEMLEKYDTLMSTNYFKENVKEIFVGSYPFYNYMGVMMEIGEQGQNVWIDQDKNGTLGIYAINAG